MKFTKTHERQLREYIEAMDEHGIVTMDQWTSGNGRFSTVKALPPFVQVCENREYKPAAMPTHGTPEHEAYNFFKANPKRRKCLVLDKEAFYSFIFENVHLAEF